ncbi:DEAD/DEAH box helicase [Corynebacterium sp. 335C]
MPSRSFADLGVSEPIARLLTARGLSAPTPVQAEAIPAALTGRDVAACAPTGTGKTLAYAIPLVQALAEGHSLPGRPRALVITPTRELADQVGDVLADVAAAHGLRALTLVGGEPIARQRTRLAMPADVVAVTPGRAVELHRTGLLSLDDVRVLVVDEADELADLGFLPDVTRLAVAAPQDAQRMLLSATLDDRVEPLAQVMLGEPVRVDAGGGADAGTVTGGPAGGEPDEPDRRHHLVLRVAGYDEADALVPWLAAREGRTLLFVSSKSRVAQVSGLLAAAGVAHGTLHGDRGRVARRDALAAFASGETPVLVATDVAARGLHVPELDLVVHVDPPADAATYLHRSGRTARAGAVGAVAAIVRAPQAESAARMYAAAGIEPEEIDAEPGSKELADAVGARRPRPRRNRDGRSGGGQGGRGSGSSRNRRGGTGRVHRPKRTKGGRGKGRSGR